MGELPDLQVSAFTAEDAFAYWSSRPFLKPTLRASVANAGEFFILKIFRQALVPVFASFGHCRSGDYRIRRYAIGPRTLENPKLDSTGQVSGLASEL